MTVDEWNNLSKSILESAEDPAKLSTLLAEANDGVRALFSEHQEAASAVDQLTKQKMELLEANHNLFMRLGVQSKDMGKNEAEGQTDAEKITVKDLFKKEA